MRQQLNCDRERCIPTCRYVPDGTIHKNDWGIFGALPLHTIYCETAYGKHVTHFLWCSLVLHVRR